MNAVMTSIQPLWVDLIARRKKTREVRKTKPNIDTPFKSYIYCTKPKDYFSIGNSVYAASDELYRLPTGEIKFGDSFELIGNWSGQYNENNFLNGKVVGEFICDEITEIPYFRDIVTLWGTTSTYAIFEDDLESTCLTIDEINDYGKGKPLYLWNISDLVIYEQPKELSEFYVLDKDAVKNCVYRERICTNPDYTNGVFLPGSYICNKESDPDWCVKCKTKPLTRPPQSWCYVEELR